MEVTSVLELYLTAYGWEVYKVLFLTVIAFGGFLWPFIPVIVNAIREQHSSGNNGSPKDALKSVLFTIITGIIIFLVAAVPMVTFSAKQVKITSSCTSLTLEDSLAQGKTIEDQMSKVFGDSTKVPLLPYFIMSIGSGVNKVLFKQLPCGTSVVRLNDTVNAMNLNASKDKDLLVNEYRKFQDECQNKALETINQWNQGASSDAGKNAVIQALLYEYTVAQRPTTMIYTEMGPIEYTDTSEISAQEMVKHVTNYAGSKFLVDTFYTNARCNQGALTQAPTVQVDATVFDNAWNEFCTYRSNQYTHNPIALDPSVTASPSPFVGKNQADSNVNFPNCGTWWQDSLRNKLAVAATKSLVDIQQDCFIFTCSTQKEMITGISLNKAGGAIYTDVYNAMNDSQKDLMIMKALEGTNMAEGTPVSNEEGALLAGGAFIGAALDFVGITNDSLLSQATSFLTKSYVLQIIMRFLQPMILMGLYILWIFLVIFSEYNMRSIIKGLVTIFCAQLCFGLWALMDVLGDDLFQMLYPNVTSAVSSDLTGRMFIHATTTIFYFALPILMYSVISNAGGNNDSSTNSRAAAREGNANNLGSLGNKGPGFDNSLAKKLLSKRQSNHSGQSSSNSTKK